MDALEAIFTRRSVRNYTADPVSPEDIEVLVKAGMQAPSARNEQPWHFVVIEEREKLNAITEFHPASKMLLEAPMAILVCSDRTLETKRASWLQDCSAATQNILLAAHALGLGAVWLGIFPDSERVFGMQDLLNLPKHVRPVSLVAVGHPSRVPDQVDRFQPDRVHHNQW